MKACLNPNRSPLNNQGVRTDLDRDWTRATVREVLSNEKYIGNNVYNRRSFKLKKHRIVNQPEMWIKKEGAFEAIVPPEVFYMAQGIIRARASPVQQRGVDRKAAQAVPAPTASCRA
jgi:hypothetical protein